MQSLTTMISRKLARQNSMRGKMENKITNRAKMSNKRYIKASCSTYSAVIKLVKRHHEPPVLLYFQLFYLNLLAYNTDVMVNAWR